jgi:isopentenyl-diphosphate delta-isomerase type 1
MSEEIFDVVDEHDRIIGRETRAEVHRRGLRHRAIHVLVFNAQGRLFLQKRSASKDTFPGLWDSSASGHLGCGEDYDTCAVRELQEEIGLTVGAPPERLFKIDSCDKTGLEHVWVYRCFAGSPLTLNRDEIERGDWFSPETITRWIAEKANDFAPAFPMIWEICRERQLVR